MKKITYKLLTMLLALFLLVPTFASCAALSMSFADDAERPWTLYEGVMENMEELENATLTTNLTMDAYVSRQHIATKSSSVEQIDIDGDELRHHQETYVEIINGAMITESTTISGFQDGAMYYTSDQDTISGNTTQLQAPISVEAYTAYNNEYRSANGFDLHFTAKDCDSSVCEKNKDGKWVGTYTDFSKSYIERVLDDLAGVEIIFAEDYAVADIVITITADSSLNPEYIDVSFEFKSVDSSASTKVPVFSFSMEIANVDDTDIERIDLSDYQTVDDLCFITQVQTTAAQFTTQDAGKFALTTVTSLELGKKSQKEDQRFSLSFSDKGTGYFYEIGTSVDDISVRVVYSDEELNTYYNRESKPRKTEKATDAVARKTVYGLTVPSDFQPGTVTDVEKKVTDGTDVYTVKTNAKETEKAMKQILGTQARNLEIVETYTFHVKDGKLQKYQYVASCTFDQGNDKGTYTLTIIGAYSQ